MCLVSKSGPELGFGRSFEVPGEAELREKKDQPLAGIPMVPANPIAVIIRKTVMKIMIPFPVRQNSPQPMVTGGNVSIKVPAAELMGVRINEKGGVHDQDQPQIDRQDKCAQRMADPKSDQHRDRDSGAKRP